MNKFNLILISFIFTFSPLLAQEFVIDTAAIKNEANGINTEIYGGENLKYNETSLKDSILSTKHFIKNPKNTFLKNDTLITGNNKINLTNSSIEKVYSKRDWLNYPDSLKSFDNINLPFKNDSLMRMLSIGQIDYMEVLVSKVNEPLNNFKNQINTDSLTASGLSAIDEDNIVDNLTTENTAYDSIRFSNILKENNLQSIYSNNIKKEMFSYVDSLKTSNLRSMKIVVTEKLDSANRKVVTLRKKQTFKDRAYFEGILGLSDLDFLNLEFSPALGVELFKEFSVGIGPEVNINPEVDSLKFAFLGLRGFLKKDFYDKKVYLQVETSIHDFSDIYSEGKKYNLNQNEVLAGGGILLPLYSKYKLNLSVLYKLKSSEDTIMNSPLVFRLGISTIK